MPQIVTNRAGTIAVSSGTRYFSFYGGDWENAADTVGQVMSSAGVISNVHVLLTVAPGSGKSWTVTLQKNEVDTAITFSIADSATTGSDTTHSVSFSAGDVFCWKLVGVSSPASAKFEDWYLEIAPTTPGITQLGGTAFSWNNNNKVGNVSNLLGGYQVLGGEEYQAFHYVPTAGSFVAFSGYQAGAGTAATGFTAMLNLNGVDQDGSGGTVDTRVAFNFQSTKSVSSGTYNLPVVAGDIVYAKFTVVGTPGTKMVSFSHSFQATNTSEYIMGANGIGSLLANGAGLNQWTPNMSGTGGSAPAVGTSAIALTMYNTRPINITKFYFRLTNAPNSGQTRNFAVQKNGSDTSLAFTIANTTPTGNDTANGHKVGLSSGDTFAVRMGNTSSSAAFSRFAYSLVFESPGGGKGAGGGSGAGGNKKGGGGTISIQTTGGAGLVNFNMGIDIGITS